jgi:hypothetical protein
MMKITQLLVATIVLAALAATLYWSNHRKAATDSVSASLSTTSLKVLALTQDDISKLEVKKNGGDDVVLARSGASLWKITSPKPLFADQQTISTILYDLSPLDGATLIDDKASDLKQFGLAQPAAQLIATEKDGKTQTVLLGDETPTGDSAYVMLAGDSKVYSVSKNTKTNLNKDLKDLRDKRLMPVDFDKISSVEMDGAQPCRSARRHFQNGDDRREIAYFHDGPQHFGHGNEEGSFPLRFRVAGRLNQGHGRVRPAGIANPQDEGRLLREDHRDGGRLQGAE